MRRLYIVIAAAAGLYLDSVLFARVNISGIRPDAIMALTASLGVLLGMKKGALFGLIMGLIADVLYSPMVGLSAMGYMFAGLLGGAFYQKYYADNIIIPALVAAVGAIFKECVMAAACAAAIREHFYGDGIEIFADYRYYPNQLVYNKLKAALDAEKLRREHGRE